MSYRCTFLMWFAAAGAALASGPAIAAPSARAALQQAARDGDVALLRTRLQQGDDPDARDGAGRTPLLEAVSAGRLEAARVLLAAGARVDAASFAGRTPLIEAAEAGRAEATQFLISSGADLEKSQRGWGTALAAAERMGHKDVAAMLRAAGARSTGKSVGDKVCVRPWSGDGYCGTVETLDRTTVGIRVTEIVGCKGGCPARADCSAGRSVGGPDGVKAGDLVATVTSCLTHTGVQP